MNISLTPQLELCIKELPESKATLNREIQIGLDQFENGDYINDAELQALIANRRKNLPKSNA